MVADDAHVMTYSGKTYLAGLLKARNRKQDQVSHRAIEHVRHEGWRLLQQEYDGGPLLGKKEPQVWN